jgi:hypothetical protein
MQQHQHHQSLPQQTQQRQPILMGMQPQSSGPGKVMSKMYINVESYYLVFSNQLVEILVWL